MNLLSVFRLHAAVPRNRKVQCALRRLRPLLLAAVAAACSNQPPAEFAPDPSTVASIDQIKIRTESDHVCLGERIGASYDAMIGDQWIIPFATSYDTKDPPLLHISSLHLTSAEATPGIDGSWTTNPDPLVSVMTGFRLHASLRAKPAVEVTQVIEPDYSCMRHAFSFEGVAGSAGSPGGPGPDIVVRVSVLSSPFYERLLVAGIEVGEEPPFYTLADLDAVPSSRWLRVESKGGAGGGGLPGRAGSGGSPGVECARAGNVGGDAGGSGGAGGRGGAGGSGGQISVLVPGVEPLLAGLIDAVTTGGAGGGGGAGGAGGPGGLGAAAVRDTLGKVICQEGARGRTGADGPPGASGPRGNPGPPVRVFRLPTVEVFGPDLPPALQELAEYSRRRGIGGGLEN